MRREEDVAATALPLVRGEYEVPLAAGGSETTISVTWSWTVLLRQCKMNFESLES